MEKKSETTEIKVTSKATVQIGTAWYSFEASKNREMSGLTDDEVGKEQAMLWDDVNNQVDSQIQSAISANQK